MLSQIDIFLYPLLALVLEYVLYDSTTPLFPQIRAVFSRSRHHGTTVEQPINDANNVAISIQHLTKTFPTLRRDRKRGQNGKGASLVTAIDNLTLAIKRTGITCILGSNGAGKSTLLEIIGGLSSCSSGAVLFRNDDASGLESYPVRGTLGLVPQRNVLFPELTCRQTLRLWSAIKRPVGDGVAQEDIESLLADVDLVGKRGSLAGSLSGGQKRK